MAHTEYKITAKCNKPKIEAIIITNSKLRMELFARLMIAGHHWDSVIVNDGKQDFIPEKFNDHAD